MPYHLNLTFVRCPQDDPALDSSWQPSMHPYIFHECRTCGARVDTESVFSLYPAKHEIRYATHKRRLAREIGALQEAIYLNPTQYLDPPLVHRVPPTQTRG